MMQTGLEILHTDQYAALRDQRVGLMTNPGAVDRNLVSAYRLFADAAQVKLTALFGPEHGFAGAAPDAVKIDTLIDPRTGVPVFSLYGETFRPTAEMLKEIDVLVCDIQDTGVRFYTYLWTISYILEAAGEHGKRVVILDRPNPLGGTVIDGPPLEEDQCSFVGRFSVPVRHGMTVGEITRLINATWNPTPAELSVVPCTGWSRNQRWEDLHRPWVPTSPNIPRASSLHHYIGACLVEGTNLSEGRGTALPFEVVGAPWIDSFDLADRLNAQDWPGVRFRPHSFLPHQSKWEGQTCNGVQVYITDTEAWQPLHTWVQILALIRQQYPNDFAWKPAHFDRLIGSTEVRQQMEAGASIDEISAGWGAFCTAFAAERRPHLLY